MSDLTEEIKNFILSGHIGFFEKSAFCAKATGIFNAEETEIQSVLDSLILEGFLVLKEGKYATASSLNLVPADLQVTLRGYGFCIVDNAKADFFVAAEDLKGAVDGDRVLISIKRGTKRPECVIDRILERRVKNVVGTVMQSKTATFIIPDDERLGQSLEVRLTKAQISGGGWRAGDKVVAHFCEDYKSRCVYITEILGAASAVGVDILSIIRQHNLYEEFPAAVVSEAKKVAAEPSAEEIARRTDLRNKLVVTIDPEDAKDLDDGISLERKPGGYFELGVHIADVSHYVAADSELDKEAYKRGTSVYFPNVVLPMLPRQLSNNVCSLTANAPRLALSVLMTMDKSGNVTDHKVVESVIDVKKRYTYSEVQKILDEVSVDNNPLGSPDAKSPELVKIEAMLNDMAEMTLALEKNRQARGEVVFNVPEPRIILDERTGKIKDVIAYPHLLSHRIVESFMVLCNEVVAKNMYDLNLPFIYRIHEKPDSAKAARFVESLKPFKIEHKINPENPTGKAYQALIGGLDENIKPIISMIALRSMQKAKYSPDCIGHFALGAKYYCHFTSPIRRYPDLVIHRIIKMMLNRKLSSHKMMELREFTADASEQSSKTELAATDAEREVDNLKRAEYMYDRIGERFQGHISGIQDFGVFVYLPNTVEGLVRIENMPGGSASKNKEKYVYNEKQVTLTGTKRTYKMGDKIEVIVAGVNLPRRQVEFTAVSQDK